MSDKVDLHLAVFNASYDRKGIIELTTGRCDVCGTSDVPVIYIDGSEGEYGGGNICQPCSLGAFNRY